METTTTKCVSCKSDILLEDAMLLHWCNIEDICETEEDKKEAQPLLCKNCTFICDNCKVSGCVKCIKTLCSTCNVSMCSECKNNDNDMCGCYGKCYTCGKDINRAISGSSYCECGIWSCSDCRKSDKNPCNECGTPIKEPEKVEEKVEEVKTTFNCESCKTTHPLEKAIRCELCNINDEEDDDEEDDDDDDNGDDNKDDEDEDEDEDKDKVSVDSWDGKIKHLFCKKCTLKCDACGERGCKECVEFVCCDCGYNMCYECRNNEVDCGCYGHCYSCGTDVDRGSDGWPCGECEKWYCCDCRRYDNPCKECGPESESESESESDEEEN